MRAHAPQVQDVDEIMQALSQPTIGQQYDEVRRTPITHPSIHPSQDELMAELEGIEQEDLDAQCDCVICNCEFITAAQACLRIGARPEGPGRAARRTHGRACRQGPRCAHVPHARR